MSWKHGGVSFSRSSGSQPKADTVAWVDEDQGSAVLTDRRVLEALAGHTREDTKLSSLGK